MSELWILSSIWLYIIFSIYTYININAPKIFNSATFVSTYLHTNVPSKSVFLFFLGWKKFEICAFMFMLSARICTSSFRKNNWKSASASPASYKNWIFSIRSGRTIGSKWLLIWLAGSSYLHWVTWSMRSETVAISKLWILLI